MKERVLTVHQHLVQKLFLAVKNKHLFSGKSIGILSDVQFRRNACCKI